jgi:hypothetical protein
MFVCCECCVLSGRGLCDGLITRPEESYRLWRVVVCYQETSKTRMLKPATGLWKIQTKRVVTPGKQTNKETNKLNLWTLLQSSPPPFPRRYKPTVHDMELKQRNFISSLLVSLSMPSNSVSGDLIIPNE